MAEETNSQRDAYRLTVVYQNEQGEWYNYGTVTIGAATPIDAYNNTIDILRRSCTRPVRIVLIERVNPEGGERR
jgi:hypothetical protein